jgi:Tubulin-tyrosine ligase family
LLETFGPRVLGAAPLDATLMSVARLFSWRVRVLVACWHQLEITGESARLRPPFLEFEDGEYRVWLPEAAVEVDAMWHFPVSGQRRTPLTDEEADAEKRLRAAGIRCDGVPGDTSARALSVLAQRGIPTNGSGLLGRLGRKDQLEYALRWYEAATGRLIARPETHPCTGADLTATLALFGDRDCIVKPANSRGGQGIHLMAGGSVADDGFDPGARFVVQELIRDPLVLGGSKTDLRCYLLVVPRDRARSRRVGPIFARASAAPYERLVPEAEITNTSLRRRLGLAPSIQPLETSLGRDPAFHAALVGAVEDMCASLLDFAVAWRDAHAAAAPGTQVMLWGLDLLVSGPAAAAEVSLLEINVYPQLHRSDLVCDTLVDEMLLTDYLPELMSPAVLKERLPAGAK